MLIRAPFVLPVSADPIRDGAVRTDGKLISWVGRAEECSPGRADEIVYELTDCILAPGLVNAHCHLDYTEFKGSIEPSDSFSEWIRKINALKKSYSTEDFLRSIDKGFTQLMTTGTTTVANIEALPELLPQMPPPPIRTWWFLELIDLRNKRDDEATMYGAFRFFEAHPEWLGGFGLSPHAPYTASIELYRLAKYCAEMTGMPFTTHVAESVEEYEMFTHGRGALYDFLGDLGRDNSDCGQGTPISHLVEHGVLKKGGLAAHLNYLSDYDFDALRGLDISIVHCPKCHTYFGHRAFEYQRLRKDGHRICLGTDSLASNNSLDMRSEMREFLCKNPGVSAQTVLQMGTVDGAAALNQAGKIGQLTPGALADLVAFPLSPEAATELERGADPHMAFVQSRAEAAFLMVDGEMRIKPSGKATNSG